MTILDRQKGKRKIYVVETIDIRVNKKVYMVFNSMDKIESWNNNTGTGHFIIQHVEEVPFKVIGRYLPSYEK